MSDLKAVLNQISDGESLTVDEAESAFDAIMTGTVDNAQIAGLLVGLQAKGVVATEVAGGVRALRSAMIPVEADEPDELVDTCGTGGGSVTTFNISTAAAIVAAAAGVRIAKHGNRSFSSKSGSADVLEALGVTIERTPEEMAAILREQGIVFMFAPLLHPAMRHVGPVRRALGIRTIMNLLGPLTNPAGARRQMVGVAERALVPLVVGGLQELGHAHALVVHGSPGMDEISPCGPTEVAELVDGEVREYTVQPEDFGLESVDPASLAGGEPEENAAIVEAVLAGEVGGPRTAVVLNAAGAIYLGGKAADLGGAVVAAQEAIDSGRAMGVLEGLRG